MASAIRAARAVLEEVPEAMGSSIRIMAGCGEKNSERDAHRVARRCRVTLPIMITEVMIHGWQVPLILLSAWLTFLLGRNLLHTLSGLPHPDLARSHATWKCFWSRYQKLYPNHDVFRRAAKGELDLSRTVGLVLHGDEGRTKKKSAILVLSCHSILGYGSHATDPQPEPYCKQYLNMTGHTLSTRWVLGCLPKTYYDGEDGDNFFQEYLNVFVEDMLRVYEKGIKAATGEVYHFVILNVIGDWPWFVKAFSLIRNFANCSKQETSRAPSKGICHVCKADMMNYPFEDFTSASPAWRATINEERAYSGSPSLLRLPKDPTDESAFLGQDIFHGWHLGAAKQFLASCLVLLQEIFPGRSIPSRFEVMSADFFSWCKRHKLNPLIRRITRETVGWPSAADYPCASWNKGSTSTCVLRWFLSACARHAHLIEERSILQYACMAAREINLFLSKSYKEAVWVSRLKGLEICRHGFRFLRLLGHCARLSYDSGRPLFLMTPNVHRIHHLFYLIWDHAQVSEWTLNICVFCCQIEEDYIGRPSRTSRRVAPQQVIRRTLERVLAASYAKFVEAGFLIPCQFRA